MPLCVILALVWVLLAGGALALPERFHWSTLLGADRHGDSAAGLRDAAGRAGLRAGGWRSRGSLLIARDPPTGRVRVRQGGEA
jgi:hypothetical protein